jgi:hypothetical protein
MFLSPIFLSQVPAPSPGAIENWLIPAAAVASMALLFRKLFPHKRSDDEFLTKSELHHELSSVRDKIDARFLTLAEKIETLGTTIHEKLTSVESAVARLDERTKK